MKSPSLADGLARQLLAVLLLVAGLAVVGLGLTAYYSERQALQAQVIHQLASLAELKEQELQTWLAERAADVELLAVNHLNQEHFSELFDERIPEPRKVEFAAFLADNLRGLQRARTGYVEISMVDMKGNVRISTDGETVEQPVKNQEVFTRALAAPDGKAIQDIYYNTETNRPEMAWAHTILAIDLETGLEKPEATGVLIAVVDVRETIYPLLGPLATLGDTAETLLVRREGDNIVYLNDLLFHEGRPLTLRIPNDSTAEEGAQRAARGESGVVETEDYRGAPVLAAYRPIGNMGWGFIAKQDQVQAFAPVRELTVRMIGWAMLVLLGTGILAMWLANRMTRPLTQLVKASERVAEGNLDIHIYSDRQDEIGALARSFQGMVDALVERGRQGASLTRVLELLNRTPDFTDVFHLVAAELHTHLGFAHISLLVFDAQAETFSLLVTAPSLQGETVPPFSLRQTPLAAVLSGHLHFARDLAAAQDSPLDRLLYAQGVRSRIAVPLTVEEKVVGMISMGWITVAGYDLARLSMLNQVAGALALALARWRLFGEVRRRADQLAQAYVALQQADQLKDDFIRNITHELRTPVAILSGYTELLLDDDENLRTDQVEMLWTIATQSGQLTRLVNDVVALHRVLRESEEKVPLRINDLAQDSLLAIEQSIRAEDAGYYHFCLDCVDQTLTVLGNGAQLGRVFANVLNNAVKFSPTGGQVRVAIDAVPGPLLSYDQSDAGAQLLGANEPNSIARPWVQVAISDQGIGIPQEQQEKVWERFVQLDASATRRYGGTGLGLALVREIVEAHGGHVWIDSAPSQGTTIFFMLPSAEADLHRSQNALLKRRSPEPPLDAV